jgi:hypothetical protein
MRLALPLVLVLAACGTSAPAPPPTPPPPPPALVGETNDGCFVAEGAPDPFACVTADDCIAGGRFEPERCCMTGDTHTHSRAYHGWQTDLFRARCDGSCIAPPSEPLACQLISRCVAGRCRDGCDVEAGDGALDGMDESEIEAACARGVSAACDRLGH